MSYEKSIDRFIGRVREILTLRYALALLAVFFFLWGTAVLVLRFALGKPAFLGLWGLAAILPALVAAYMRAGRNLPSPVAVRALLDRESDCGGLLMAAAEVEIGTWKKRLPEPKVPSLHWRVGKTGRTFALSLLFLAVSLLLPQKYVAAKEHHRLEIGEEVDKLSRQIEVLDKEELIESGEAEALAKDLQHLEEEALGEDPVKALESLDYMDRLIRQTAQKAAEEGIKETEELTQTEALTQGILEDEMAMDPNVRTQAMAELAAMVDKAAENGKQLQKRLSREAKESCRSGELDAGEMREILDALRRRKEEIREMLQQLEKNGMLDQSALEECDRQGECNSKGLAEFLQENANRQSVPESVRTWSRTGEGAPEEGPGARGMDFWDTPTPEEGANFKEEILPVSQLPDLHQGSQLLGEIREDPETQEKTAATESGVLDQSRSGDGSASRHTILPQHRAIVKRYFERK